jgi:hypothetical protein
VLAGLALTAFGGGAVIAAPLIQEVQSVFAVAPTYLGIESEVAMTVKDAVRAVFGTGCPRCPVV